MPLFFLKFLLELAVIPQETQIDGASQTAERFRPRAPYIAACCDRQYRPRTGNGAALDFPPEPSAKPGSELAGLGQLDLNPQLDLGQDRIETGVARRGFEVRGSVA